MEQEIGFSAWLKKYFNEPQMKLMYRAKIDGFEYSITELEEKYIRSRSGTKSNGCPKQPKCGGKNKNG